MNLGRTSGLPVLLALALAGCQAGPEPLILPSSYTHEGVEVPVVSCPTLTQKADASPRDDFWRPLASNAIRVSAIRSLLPSAEAAAASGVTDGEPDNPWALNAELLADLNDPATWSYCYDAKDRAVLEDAVERLKDESGGRKLYVAAHDIATAFVDDLEGES